MSRNHQSVHKIAKFKYFAKVNTCSKFPDQVPQSHILESFRKISIRTLISDKFSFQQCIICVCYFNSSQMTGGGLWVGEGGGGGGETPPVLYPAKCVQSERFKKRSAHFQYNAMRELVCSGQFWAAGFGLFFSSQRGDP